MNIEKMIELYAELPEPERREVDRYVEEHSASRPDLRSMLEEARRWDALLASARTLGMLPPDEEALAFYAVMKRADPDRLPESLRDVFRRIEDALAADPGLREQLRTIEGRLEELEAATTPEAQFDLLVGDDDRVVADATSISAEPRAVTLAAGEAAPRTAASGNGAGKRVRVHPLRRAAAALLAAAVLYGALFVVGPWLRPEPARLARFEQSELQVSRYDGLRGNDARGDTTDVATLYLTALDQLARAETTVLGLFPRFNQARLDSGAALLRRVIEMEPEDSFLAGEAMYLLGKTELARGNIPEAVEALQSVAESGGRRAPDAERVLERIHR